MTAASNTRRIVVTMGGIRNAFAKAELTELLITWLMPHQQIRPEMANREAVRECLRVFPVFASINGECSKPVLRDSRRKEGLVLCIFEPGQLLQRQ